MRKGTGTVHGCGTFSYVLVQRNVYARLFSGFRGEIDGFSEETGLKRAPGTR